jgi:hypothetical protein
MSSAISDNDENGCSSISDNDESGCSSMMSTSELSGQVLQIRAEKANQ